MKRHKGSILITTLWIMVILSLLALGIGFRASIEVRLGSYNMDKMRARYLAMAGIMKAQEYLLKDKNKPNGYDSIYACGIPFDTEETSDKIFSAFFNKLKTGEFEVYYTSAQRDDEGNALRYYGMVDEQRKLNIKLSFFPDAIQYKETLRSLFPNLGDIVIDNMINWQDVDEEGGHEKNKDFESLQELLLVEEMTPALFNEIKDFVTVYGDGKINLNTASWEVLSAILGDSEMADIIVDNRSGDTGGLVNGYFGSVPEVSNLFKGDIRASLINEQLFTVESDNFTIISHGVTRNIEKVITCVVKRPEAGGTSFGEMQYYHED